jgi:replicative DNA helicase
MSEKNFGYLGFDFQQKLIKTIIEDKKYADRIIDIIESKYFENTSFKFIMENIKEFHNKFERVPDYITLSQKIVNENGNNSSSSIHLDTLEILKNLESNPDYVQETALNFCRQQNLKKTLKRVDKIIEGGEFEKYSEIEGLIVEALQVGIDEEEPADVFDNLEEALEKNYRHPISTGIIGIDNLLKGGLGRGELAVVLAPTGVGKSTVLTKISNTAYNMDYNVLQIFFEDNLGDIKRKHYTIWSGVPSDDQPDNKTEVIEKVHEARNRSKGDLKLLKLPSSDITISQIKSIVRKKFAEGFKIDLLVIDYVDCIQPERSVNGDEWKGEGSIMRSLEAMAGEFNIAIWTATQGGRDSISSDVVNTDQMGGSIKKAQIAHVIVSIAKTLEQKEHNLATIALLKSRIGKDGIVFENCRFNNELLIIDTESQNTLLGIEEQKTQNRQERARAAFLKRQEVANKE